MKRLILIFFIFISIYPQVQEESFICKHFEGTYKLGKSLKLNYPGDDRFDVTYYHLDLSILFTPNFIEGRVIINAHSLIDGLQQIFLDLKSNMLVDGVKSSNTNLTYTHLDDKIYIDLDRQYSSGESFSITVNYRGTPQSNGFGSFQFHTRGNGKPAIWSLSEPYGSSDWWPCKDTPADKADSSDFWITCEDNFQAVSNGTLVEVVDQGNGIKTYKWKNRYPIAQYLISVAMADYIEYIDYFNYSANDSMLVIHYNYPENFDFIRMQDLDRTIPMLNIFSEKFGEYPFITEKYGHAEFARSGGMEHQTLTSMGNFTEYIVAHELAHQWFGDKITCIDWHNIWLNEGFATYSECLYAEEYYGWNKYTERIVSKMGTPGDPWTAKGARGSIYVEDITSVGEIFNTGRSYNKAAIVLHMLRGVVGHQVFFDILRSYSEDPELAYGVASTEDFQRVAEAVSGTDLDYFFSEWIYGENYPEYFHYFEYSPIGSNLYDLKVTIGQTSNNSPSFFTMPIELRISTETGDTLVNVFNDQSTQIFRFTVSGRPTNVELDPNNWILKDINPISRVPGIDKMKHYYLSQNFPNPFNPTTTIIYYLPEYSDIKITLYDILGNKISDLVDGYTNPGKHMINLSAAELASGTYFYRMTSDNYAETKKLILIK